jgi:hypothetical protein
MRAYRSFAEFWPFYLREHSRPGTRALHYAGTSSVVLIALAALLTGTWGLLLAMPVAGYAFAWASHAAIERNRPATFTYPAWSLAADFKMWWLWLTGRLGPELRRAGLREQTGGRPSGR